MQAGINLIPELTEKEIKSGVYRKKINLSALLSLGVVGIIVFALISYQGYLFLQANSITNRTQKAEEEIANYRNLEVSTLALKEKINQINELLNNSLPASSAIAEVETAAKTTNPIQIKQLEVAENGEVLVGGTAVTADDFTSWIDNLTTNNRNNLFKGVSLMSLTKNTSGYDFALRMTYTSRGVNLE